jgi:undecaprenyl-diphosphatase
MKLFFHRPRPVLPWAHVLPDYSFPSGHSMNSLALGLALAIVIWRIRGPRWGVAAVAAAALASLIIGTSRIYLGYHYLTDVVAGFAAAILWVAIVVGVFRAEVAWRGRRSAVARPGERAAAADRR